MSLESVVHRLVDVAAGLDRIGEHEAQALHEEIGAAAVVAEDVAAAAEDQAAAGNQVPSADWRPPGV